MFEWILFHVMTLQTIIVNSTSPCFMNYTAGADMWKNCGVGTDYITAALLPWQWITGGYFSMILVALFVIISYIKYQKVVYPIFVGALFFPISYFLFPAQFLSWAIIMAGLGICLLVGYIYVSQTNET